MYFMDLIRIITSLYPLKRLMENNFYHKKMTCHTLGQNIVATGRHEPRALIFQQECCDSINHFDMLYVPPELINFKVSSCLHYMLYALVSWSRLWSMELVSLTY